MLLLQMMLSRLQHAMQAAMQHALVGSTLVRKITTCSLLGSMS